MPIEISTDTISEGASPRGDLDGMAESAEWTALLDTMHEGAPAGGNAFGREERPLTVRDAASYLGVSPQTVYLWVERKQIPHLRVMGRNIRFLKSDLEPFRATFKQEVGYGTTSKI
jgi:excisionase family DNA binding protein